MNATDNVDSPCSTEPVPEQMWCDVLRDSLANGRGIDFATKDADKALAAFNQRFRQNSTDRVEVLLHHLRLFPELSSSLNTYAQYRDAVQEIARIAIAKATN